MPATISSHAAQTRLILIGAAVLLSLGMGMRQSLGLFLTPGDPRSRADRGRFHPRRRGPEHRLGPVAGAGRRDRRPFRIARHDDGRRGDLCRRAGGDGRRPGRAGADRLRRADRGRAVLHRLLAGDDRHGARGPGGAPQQDARDRLGRRVARHADDAADDAGLAGASGLADRRAVLSRCWRWRCCRRGSGRAAPTGCRAPAGAGRRCARCSAKRCAIGPFS